MIARVKMKVINTRAIRVQLIEGDYADCFTTMLMVEHVHLTTMIDRRAKH